jgi:hypothetical protein
LLGDAVVGPRDEVAIPLRHDLMLLLRQRIVIPLRQHVVDAVESDHGFHIDRDGGIGIVAVCRSKAVGRKRQQRREMPSG